MSTIVTPIHFGRLKRDIPAIRELKKQKKEEFIFYLDPEMVPDVLKKPAHMWPQEYRDQFTYYGITPWLFTKYLKGTSHMTIYELICLSKIFGKHLKIEMSHTANPQNNYEEKLLKIKKIIDSIDPLT